MSISCRGLKRRRSIKLTLEGLKKGYVDIVIGTHRVLSKDVEFKSLGLLIIDEEQRFGVAHKEKIKQMKQNVDVLTLTATPIPQDAAHEPCRDPRHERLGGTAGGQGADSDVCDGVQ